MELTLKEMQNTLKKQKLRNTEYYRMQDVMDQLYQDSKDNKVFTNLVSLMSSEQNIMLAYRNIRKNKGSKTAGTDHRTIRQLEKWDTKKLVAHIQNKFHWYKPQSVRRVEIPKPNGKTRPLGIPTITDRLVQQCILQILEPICEAKFHPRSFGFRPNRGCEHAIAAAYFKMQRQNIHYVVDIDIKGFFDNVNHGKLLKQMWTLGIQDKKLLCIISAMLKAEIAGIGYPEKGTPQGGIISPLLSNIVLNELDWWISDQWETFESRREYSFGNKYQNLRKTSRLKECYIVRYADDFKLFCRTRSDAVKLFEATKQWLKERLGLDISPEKSKIVNLKRHYSEFLGYKIKVHPKGKRSDGKAKYVVTSSVTEKAVNRIQAQMVEMIKEIECQSDESMRYKSILRHNSYVLGIHNYFQYATNVNINLSKIAFSVRKSQKDRLREELKKSGNPLIGYLKERYGRSKEIRYINGHPLLPLSAIQHRNPMNFKGTVNSYTKEGRAEIHQTLQKINPDILQYLLDHPEEQSIEFNDNRLAVYCAQGGRCAISGKILEAEDVRFCRLLRPNQKPNDHYQNIVMVHALFLILISSERLESATINATPLEFKGNINKIRKKQNFSEI